MEKIGANVATNDTPRLSAPPHTLPSAQILADLQSDPEHGLRDSQVSHLQQHFGPNRLKPPRRPSPLRILGRQCLNAMTLVLVAATAVSMGTRDWISGGVVFALVFMNICVGTWTEWRSEKTVASLENVGSPTATVIRSSGDEKAIHGTTRTIPIEQVVPGDICILVNGDIVPADARILEGYLAALEVDEALLTGESLPIRKRTGTIDGTDCPVGDRKNMVFSGSQITKGRARVVVTATGMDTELGAIAAALEKKETSTSTGWPARRHRIKAALGLADTTPLQIKLNWLAYLLLLAACLVAFIVVASTAFTNVPLSVATYAVAAAVSLLPASLVAVVSLTLATASTELAKRKALVRRMDAIEALAQVTDVCSDKTGTLTCGKMVLKKVWTHENSEYEVGSGSDPFYPYGSVASVGVTGDGSEVDAHSMKPALRDLTLCGSLANMATVNRPTEEGGQWCASGDATEIALQVYAQKLHLGKRQLTTSYRLPHLTSEAHARYELLVEHSFDSSIKRMSTAYHYVVEGSSEQGHVAIFMKGAVERILERCTRVGLEGKGAELSHKTTAGIIQRMDQMAAEGLRVLALCGRLETSKEAETYKSMERDALESDMGFLGLVGIYDPPRPESAGAVSECQIAGITTRMLTGDHPATGVAIAKAIGILDNTHPSHAVMTGQEFDALSELEIDALPHLPLVIARCAPGTKVRMIEALHRRKRATVMTGDGVNDSPALKRADVGVAMGLNGSDVAKSSAEIVLADDNFETIVRAVRKGRSVFGNLSKFLLYLLSGNVAEVVVLLIGLAFKDENGTSVFPLSPVAALWINTLSAGPPAFALGLERTAKDAMFKPPSHFKSMFTLEWFLDLVFYGILMALLTLVNFLIVLYGRYDGQLGLDCNEGYSEICGPVFEARATAFATLVLLLMLHALVCKHPERSLFRTNLFDNKVLLWTLIVLSLATVPPIYIPVLDVDVFYFQGLTWEWGMVAGSLILYLACAELWKVGKRARLPVQETNNRKISLRLADTAEVGGIL